MKKYSFDEKGFNKFFHYDGYHESTDKIKDFIQSSIDAETAKMREDLKFSFEAIQDMNNSGVIFQDDLMQEALARLEQYK